MEIVTRQQLSLKKILAANDRMLQLPDSLATALAFMLAL